MKSASHAPLNKGFAGSKETGALTERASHLAKIISEINFGFSATRRHVCLFVFFFFGRFRGRRPPSSAGRTKSEACGNGMSTVLKRQQSERQQFSAGVLCPSSGSKQMRNQQRCSQSRPPSLPRRRLSQQLLSSRAPLLRRLDESSGPTCPDQKEPEQKSAASQRRLAHRRCNRRWSRRAVKRREGPERRPEEFQPL